VVHEIINKLLLTAVKGDLHLFVHGLDTQVESKVILRKTHANVRVFCLESIDPLFAVHARLGRGWP